MGAPQRETNSEFGSVGEVANAYRSGRIGEAGLVEELSKWSYKPLPNPASHPTVDYPVAEGGTFREVTALFTLGRIPDAAYSGSAGMSLESHGAAVRVSAHQTHRAQRLNALCVFGVAVAG
jgi:hypothetical protein